MDCGPGCLKMIAAYRGKSLSMQYLRKLCKIGKQGTTMLDLIEASTQMGFKTLAAEIPLNKLSNVPLHCILHWQKEHYLVLYEINDKHVYLADPALNSKIKLGIDDFLAGWAIDTEKKIGRVLLLQPDETFKDLKEIPEHKTS